jgi:membrane protein DedA with SNARE-associated domain
VNLPGLSYGLPGIALVLTNVVADQLGLPIPAAPVLMLAGTMVAGHFGWAVVLFAAATVASFLVDSAWYFAGRRYGGRVIWLMCALSLTPGSCVIGADVRFRRWGGWALVIAKFVPGVSRVAPPLAGALRMTYRRFAPLSIAASALWIGAFLAAGALLEPQIRRLVPLLGDYGWAALGSAAFVLCGYIALKWQRSRRPARATIP